MSMQRLTTWGGDYHVNSSEAEITNGNFYGFVVEQDDTVVSIMTGFLDEAPTITLDFKVIANITGKQLSKGTRCTIEIGHTIKNFKCSAGAVMLLKSK